MRISQFHKSLSVALNKEVFDRIKEITDEDQISMSEWVRKAVDSELIKIKREGDNV